MDDIDPKPPTDLAWATHDELVEEFGRRYPSVIIITMADVKNNPDHDSILRHCRGSLATGIGLMRIYTRHLENIILFPEDYQDEINPD